MTIANPLARITNYLRTSSVLALLDQLSRISIIIGAVTYVLEIDDRRRETIYQAWQVVNSAQGTQVGGGRVEALETLVEKHVPLAYINLEGVNLRAARLKDADLTHARLGTADLSHADLRNADLTGADIRQTAFVGADLRGANLTVWGWLNNDLSDADLRDATGVTQEWLDNACGSAATQVPAGLRKPRLCGQPE
jgi:hypothetical protein